MKRSWNVFFLISQAACILAVALWTPYRRLPAPGWAVALLGFAAAVMTLSEKMENWQKVIWIAILAALLVTELRAIKKDRTESSDKALADRKVQDDAFQAVRRAQNEEFQATAAGISSVLTQAQQHFDASIKKTDDILQGVAENQEAVTGSKSYPYFQVLDLKLFPANQKPSLVMVVVGKYPLKNLALYISDITSLDKSLPHQEFMDEWRKQMDASHALNLNESEMAPGFHVLNDALAPGRYEIIAAASGGQFREVLTFARTRPGLIEQTFELEDNTGKTILTMDKDRHLHSALPGNRATDSDQRLKRRK